MKISKSKQELARIISENGGWRDGEFAAQDSDGGVGGYEVKPEWYSRSKYWWRAACGEWFMANKIKNHHQTVLSRAEYFHIYPAPDADGWIEWNGGECPVGDDSIVDVMFCNGRVGIGLSPLPAGGAGMEGWRLINGRSDIIAYRLHNPEQDKPRFCESMMGSIPEPASKPTIEQLAADYQAKLGIATRAQEEADAHRCGAEVALSKLEIAMKELGFKIELVTAKKEPELVITDW